MKKRKHGFLKFLLKVILVVAVVILVKKTGEYFIGKEFNGFAQDHPFEFAGDDYKQYVTADFKVLNAYEDEEGNVYNTVWESDSRYIVLEDDGTAKVTRPENATVTVILKESYKKFVWTVSRKFEVCVVPGQTVSAESVDVVKIEDVLGGSYNRDMAISVSTEGKLQYMLGDFKNTYVYSEQDALEVIKAYRDSFGIAENVEFRLSSVNNVDLVKNFMFDGYVGGYRIENSTAMVVVDMDTNRVCKVSAYADVDSELQPVKDDFDTIDCEVIVKEYLAANQLIANSEEVIIWEVDALWVDNRPAKTFRIYSREGIILDLTVDLTAKSVICCREPGDLLFNKKETVECTTKKIGGEVITFDATKLSSKKYTLMDYNRNIYAYDNQGIWDMKNTMDIVKKINKAGKEKVKSSIPITLMAIIEYPTAMKANAKIVNDSKDFSSGQYRPFANAYANIQATYDFYKDLGRDSVDNKGAEITLLLDCDTLYDNASWVHGENMIMIGKNQRMAYSYGYCPEVLGHEFTHGVNAFYIKSGSESGSINEAYADIFGCLIKGDDEWTIGNVNREDNLNKDSKVYLRNLMDINYYVDGELRQRDNVVYPTRYKGENWNQGSDSHVNGVILGHVAYKMYVSDLFTKDEVAKIWYNSLGYGYDANATFHTCRAHVMKAAAKLGCTDQQLDFIAYEFDQVEIFDPYYEYKTLEYKQMILEEELKQMRPLWPTTGFYEDDILKQLEEILKTQSQSVIIQSKSEAVPGDPILDDDKQLDFFVFYSVVATMFGDGTGIYIYQEDCGASDEEMKQVSEKLSKAFNEQFPDVNWNGNDIIIEVEQVDKFRVKGMEKICDMVGKKMKGFTLQALEIDEEALNSEEMNFFKEIWSYVFNWYHVESTAYDFYDELGLIK